MERHGDTDPPPRLNYISFRFSYFFSSSLRFFEIYSITREEQELLKLPFRNIYFKKAAMRLKQFWKRFLILDLVNTFLSIFSLFLGIAFEEEILDKWEYFSQTDILNNEIK